MSRPASREELKQYALRRLGYPVIKIEVDDGQLEDIIDDCLQYYQDYHFDASERVYLSTKLTATDITNQYISVPDNIISVIKMFPLYAASGDAIFFDIKYQIRINDWELLNTAGTLHYYDQIKQHLSMVENMFLGVPNFVYQRHQNRLTIATNWSRFAPGDWIVVEAQAIIDPTVYTDVWNDMFLKEFVYLNFKQRWGNNLKKFDNVQMPGGVTFNGQKIYDEATQEITDLKARMLNDYSPPLNFFVG